MSYAVTLHPIDFCAINILSAQVQFRKNMLPKIAYCNHCYNNISTPFCKVPLFLPYIFDNGGSILL